MNYESASILQKAAVQAATCGTATNIAEYEPVRFLDVLHEVPLLIQTVPATSWGSLMACCRDTHHMIQANGRSIINQVVTLPSQRDWATPSYLDQPAGQPSSTSRHLIKVQIPLLVKTSRQGLWPLLSKLLLAGGFIHESALSWMTVADWQLTPLCLSNTSLRPGAIVFLCIAGWPNLADLDLSYNSWEPNDTQVCLLLAFWPKLQTLNLRCCHLTGQSIALISHANWCVCISSGYAANACCTVASHEQIVPGCCLWYRRPVATTLNGFVTALKINAWLLLCVELRSKGLQWGCLRQISPSMSASPKIRPCIPDHTLHSVSG